MKVNVTNCPQGSISYTIRAGDTLYSLAIRYGTTVNAIMSANPGINPNALQIGQVICIPTQAPPANCPPGSTSYTIRAGDTFYNIAMRYNTTVQALINANPGVNPNALRIGQIICIPGTTPPPGTCPAGTFAYTVRSGDTLYSLANRYNTTVQGIIAANPNTDLSYLRIGQILCIPGSSQGTCPPNTIPYTIRSGDTFYSLAQRYGTTVAAIQAANPGVNPNRLQIGQTICIPR
ncbi:LysM peptidoglycan-binding domain-containing protein [Irregularibacter muris]|uniref:LysM peptidoglycan-binding domain-containing protein n=1 Tax=Irregularibacter muris TaxID=1796619 RepID=A0AAE3HG69_9FIRM|nr:LysM peptidoglycan-binding domain-containing protein [Irregularibacter muris]MCR1898839.1 LysM peptidoglycan-binding domain-containing protein [Irregularibacter muris]